MNPWSIILTLALAHFTIAATPGPNFILVLQSAMRQRRLGFIAAMGIWPAGILWATAGLAGLGAVIAAFPVAETAMRLISGSYLLYLGYKSVRSVFSVKAQADLQPSLPSTVATLRAGFITNITNPKGIAYFMSIFTATGAFALTPGFKVLAVLMMPSISFCWYCIMTMLVSSSAVQAKLKQAYRWLDALAGGLMLAFGAKLLVLK